MHNIRYSNLALIDLEDAIYHIAKESKTNALAYLSKYEEKIELLKLNPFMGVECKSKLIKKECRILVHESHIIIYKVNTNINEIFIIRIFHSSEDYTNKFDRE